MITTTPTSLAPRILLTILHFHSPASAGSGLPTMLPSRRTRYMSASSMSLSNILVRACVPTITLSDRSAAFSIRRSATLAVIRIAVTRPPWEPLASRTYQYDRLSCKSRANNELTALATVILWLRRLARSFCPLLRNHPLSSRLAALAPGPARPRPCPWRGRRHSFSGSAGGLFPCRGRRFRPGGLAVFLALVPWHGRPPACRPRCL